jgi:hypothetical protein
VIQKQEMPDDPPPILGRWGRVYAFVLCYLACVIALFRLFAVHFEP